jgi:predicted TPR repeat methyltransferase
MDSVERMDDHGEQHFGEQFFDESAATWDANPEHAGRADAVVRAIAEAIDLDPSMRVLEYGAGTGLVSQALGAQVGPLTLADASHGMRQVIQAKIDAGDLPGARVWDLDLATGPVPAGEQFELIVTVMTLHHIPDLDRVLRGLAALLAGEGRLCIVDLDEEDGSFHSEGFAGHHGFARDALTGSLEAAGFADIALRDCHQMVRDGVPYSLFLATCRPAS